LSAISEDEEEDPFGDLDFGGGTDLKTLQSDAKMDSIQSVLLTSKKNS
jgi:hypothetical protein